MYNKHPQSFTLPTTPAVTLSAWLQAMRLRTLPLAAAGMLSGAMLAWQQQSFRASVFTATLCTALLLQIFSNLANDYGDALNGADQCRGDGPRRMVATGLITPAQMRQALAWCALLCVISGLWLLSATLPTLPGLAGQWWLWLLLGTLSLLAAWTYTAGRRPYGYIGLGDTAVWLFFGLLAVLGSLTLYGGTPNLPAMAAANALGLWCAAVLNINNMRDIKTDLATGKHTIAARLGVRAAKRYHMALLLLAGLCWSIWLWHSVPATTASTLCILLLLCCLHHGHDLQLWQKTAPSAAIYNRQLAQLSLFVLLWVTANWLALYWFQAA